MNLETAKALAKKLRGQVNPKYADQIGTESWERRTSAEAIEYLCVEIEKAKAEIERRARHPV